MLCPRSGNGIPYLALRPTRNRLVIQYIFIKSVKRMYIERENEKSKVAATSRNSREGCT